MAEREDKRLDDLVLQVNHGFARVDRQFDRVDGEIVGLRMELRDTRAELRTEMQEGFARVDKQSERIHRWAVALVVAMLGLFGTNLVQGIGG